MDVFKEGEPIALISGGWYAPESAGPDSFRWVRDGAQLNVAQLTRAPYELLLEVEPGPAVGNKPFDLVVLENGSPFATAKVPGRQTLRIDLGSGAPRVRALTLKAENGAPPLPLPGDPRVLKYRVFRLAVERKVDVVSLAKGLRIGQGWYALESFNGETFRWVGAEVSIEVQPGAHVESLTLDVEPGPGVDSKPFKLRVLAGDSSLGEIVVKYRERIEIPWPKSANGAALRLQVVGGGKLVPSDQRVMNFRAFATVD